MLTKACKQLDQLHITARWVCGYLSMQFNSIILVMKFVNIGSIGMEQIRIYGNLNKLMYRWI
jgi:pheromone shutdown protein TraB